jgi:hypothetical protein
MADDDDDITRLTIRLQTDTVNQLQEELSHLDTEAARIRYLAQFYLDYKEMKGYPMPVDKSAEERDEDD